MHVWEGGLVITKEQLRLVAVDLSSARCVLCFHHHGCLVVRLFLPHVSRDHYGLGRGDCYWGVEFLEDFFKDIVGILSVSNHPAKGTLILDNFGHHYIAGTFIIGDHLERGNLDLEQFAASIIDGHSTFRKLFYGHRKRDGQRSVETLFDSSPMVIFCNNIPMVTISWLHLRVFPKSAAGWTTGAQAWAKLFPKHYMPSFHHFALNPDSPPPYHLVRPLRGWVVEYSAIDKAGMHSVRLLLVPSREKRRFVWVFFSKC